jgi:hypothetical protein
MIYLVTQKIKDRSMDYCLDEKYTIDSIYDVRSDAIKRLEELTGQYDWEVAPHSGRAIKARKHKQNEFVITTIVFEITSFGELKRPILIGKSWYLE